MSKHPCEYRDTFYCNKRHLEYHWGWLFEKMSGAIYRLIKISVDEFNKIIELINRASK